MRCWLGWHAWIRMNDNRLTVTFDDRIVDRICTRCGRTEYWE